MSTQTLHCSDTFIWSLTDLLGSGAQAKVYKCRHRTTGEYFAVKEYSSNSFTHGASSAAALERELETLKKMKHKNIVSVINIEYLQLHGGNSPVVIMEYCSGKSLFDMITSPQFCLYGLPETEFLKVVHDVADGVKYFREKQYIHRDIKPGNIMRSIAKDSTSTYKLTDFGAARPLNDEESFTSLHGTEEYLYPYMYSRALLKHRAGVEQHCSFSAIVDLWSLGATFYHVASGSLPFRAFGGRNDPSKMFEITSKKAQGVISGTQQFAGGEIVWSKHFPSNCLLGLSLRSLVEPMLGHMMESKVENVWTFEQFFTYVSDLVSKIPVYVYNLSDFTESIIYLNTTDTLNDLKKAINTCTHIACDNQILFLNDNTIDSIFSMDQLMSEFPKTSSDEPIILMTRDQRSNQIANDKERYNLPTFQDIQNTNIKVLMQDSRYFTVDYRVCHKILAVLHDLKRRIKVAQRGIKHARHAVQTLVRQYLTEFRQAETNFQIHKRHYESLRERLDALCNCYHIELNFIEQLVPQSTEAQELLVRMSDLLDSQENFLRSLKTEGESLQTRVEQFDQNCVRDWELSSKLPTFPWFLESSVNILDEFDQQLAIVEKIRLEFLEQSRGHRIMVAADYEIHRLDRCLVERIGRECRFLYFSRCINDLMETQQNVVSWCQQIARRDKTLLVIEDEIEAFKQNLDEFDKNFKTNSCSYSDLSSTLIEATFIAKPLPLPVMSESKTPPESIKSSVSTMSRSSSVLSEMMKKADFMLKEISDTKSNVNQNCARLQEDIDDSLLDDFSLLDINLN